MTRKKPRASWAGRPLPKWRGLPSRFGRWHTVYMHMYRWTRKGILDRVLACLQEELGVHVDVSALGLDSTSVKVHPDGAGAQKKGIVQQNARTVR